MSLTKFWAGCCAAAIGLSVAASARATVFFTDTFSYDNGQLTSADGTMAVGTGANVSGGNWVNHSSLSGFIQVADGAAILSQPGGEDANRLTNVSLTPGTTWFYGARVKVTDLREPLGAGPFADAYFMHFKEDGTVNFRGRGFITAGTDPAKFTFGVTSSSSSPTAAAAKWATDLDFGTEYTIVVAYTADDDDTNAGLVRDGFTDLWVNPANMASTSVTDSNPNVNVSTDLTDPMIALAIRQSQAAAGPASVALNAVAAGDSFAEVLAALSPVTPTNNSDFDNDGDVDGADFLTWQANLGATGVPVGNKSTGDANGDGSVNAADLGVWQAHFGLPPAVGAAGSVPEPTAAVLLATALAGIGLRRRRV